jgi:hypothetical protein
MMALNGFAARAVDSQFNSLSKDVEGVEALVVRRQ